MSKAVQPIAARVAHFDNFTAHEVSPLTPIDSLGDFLN
jgi:hypothetical protein